MIITEDISDEMQSRISRKWEIDNIEELEPKGDVIIRTNKEWYFPDSMPDIQRTIAL